MGSNRIYVGNLSYDTREDNLRELFERGGHSVTDIHIVTDRETGRSRGFAFVEVATPEMLSAAISGLDGQELDGRRIALSEARPRTPREGGGGGGGGFDRPRGPGGGGGRFNGGGGGGSGPPSGDRRPVVQERRRRFDNDGPPRDSGPRPSAPPFGAAPAPWDANPNKGQQRRKKKWESGPSTGGAESGGGGGGDKRGNERRRGGGGSKRSWDDEDW
jgi:RNA recognition motif-containing protein